MILSEGTMENSPPGIDPETVRLVTQLLNQYATPGLKISVTGAGADAGAGCTRHGHQHRVKVTRGCIDKICLS